jgi:hypothetical protein
MTKYEKTIAALGLTDNQKHNAFLVTYKTRSYCVYTDGAGLDMISLSEFKDHDQSNELFAKLVDVYTSVGLLQALLNANASIVPVKKASGYKMYKVQGHYELWRGRMSSKNGYRAGYVSNPDNMQEAIYAAQEEMRCLMAEAI